jgi:hypothetical protein
MQAVYRGHIDREYARAKGAIHGNRSIFIGHVDPLVGGKLAQHSPKMVKRAPAPFGQRFKAIHFYLILME